MIFNSLLFVSFFCFFFFLYWLIFNKSKNQQNILLLIGSYVFYGWADWRLLTIIIGSSIINYFLGIQIEKNSKFKKIFLYLGLIQGVGGLVYFKYFNFFITSFNDAFLMLNVNLEFQTLSIIIPLGISFFTFRTISYLLDIDKGKIEATKDIIVFLNYVSFFPSVLSGPIDKAKLFVPQLEKKRKFSYNNASDGSRQFLWGLFKKTVIADNCIDLTDQIFDSHEILRGSTLLFGAFIYTIQIYTDFSGYSDMAIGISRLLGFKVSKNFDFPLFSQNIAEFWRRWHISLTSWLTEYVFTPLSIAFRDYSKTGLIMAIVINFTIIGVWHGANWTYILFGFMHGCYYIPLIIKGTMNKKIKTCKDKLLPSLKESMNIILNILLVSLTFVLFRSETIEFSASYLSRMFSLSLFKIPDYILILDNKYIIIAVFLFLFIEWIGRSGNYAIEKLRHPIRYGLYYILLLSIFFFSGNQQEFIYFQF